MTDIKVVNVGNFEEDGYTVSTYKIIAGEIEVGCAEIMNSEGGACVMRIDVDETHRNHGYGTAALNALSRMYNGVLVAPDNEDARRLYDRIGYDVTDKGDNWAMDQGFGVYEI